MEPNPYQSPQSPVSAKPADKALAFVVAWLIPVLIVPMALRVALYWLLRL